MEQLKAMGFEDSKRRFALERAVHNLLKQPVRSIYSQTNRQKYDLETAANILALQSSGESQSRSHHPKDTLTSPLPLPPPPFAVHAEPVELETGCFIDCRDKFGMWLEAEVVQRKG